MGGYQQAVILFDGICNFCNFWVNILISLDKRGRYRFAALQSEAGQVLQESFNLPPSMISVILVEQNLIYTESTAILRICLGLGGCWKVLYLLNIIPTKIRDRLYHWVAKNRYRLFGKRETCMVPTPEVRKRFMDVEEAKCFAMF